MTARTSLTFVPTLAARLLLQALAIAQPRRLWESEIGPLGGDEINILWPGHNYGWPLVSTGRPYTGTPVSDHPWTRDGMDDPRMFWVPAISPSGLIFYTGDRFKDWKCSAFLGAPNGKALWRVSLSHPRP